MLSKEEIQDLGRVARITLDEEEQEILCRDLNALLELVSVLEPLPGEDPEFRGAKSLGDLREDVETVPAACESGRRYAVPRVMEKN